MSFYIQLTDSIIKRAKQIKLLIMDVDGVLSDGKIYYTSSQEQTKSFFVRDGLGIALLHQNQINTAIITGRNDLCVKLRAEDLNIKHYFPGCVNKKTAFDELITEEGLQPCECAYIGDDIIDLPVMSKVGLAVAVRDAHSNILTYSHYVTEATGGRGAVRELCDIILYAQDKLNTIMGQFTL